MEIPKPQFDDRLIRNIINQSIASQAILVAYDVGLFEAIGHDQKKIDEICRIISLPEKSVLALLTLCAHYKLINFMLDCYELTAYSKEYFLKESPFCFGDVLNLIIQQNTVRSYSAIKTGLITGKPQVYSENPLFEIHETSAVLLENFTKAMHAKSIAPGTAWPELINFSKGDTILDIGGGAGTHTICACLKWPDIKGIIYERPNVCKIAKQYIKDYKLEDRIGVQDGDMWSDPFPAAEIHFYSDIFHDWSPEKADWLANKSFSSLPKNGQIVIHEMLFDNNKFETFNVAAYNLNMLLWTEGQQFSGDELKAILRKAGFIEVNIQKTFGDWHIIIGCKP